MKLILLLIVSLLITFPLNLLSLPDGIFSKNSTIVHLVTGLFLDYVGLYRPSDKIIHNSVIFPMTTETCFILPLDAAANIPSCNITLHRRKRSFLGGIALAIGMASLGISKMNSVQIANLEQQVHLVEKSLLEFNEALDLQEAKLANIHSFEIKIIEELYITQRLIDSLSALLNLHARILNRTQSDITQLYMNSHFKFVMISIQEIFRNHLNLNFLLPEDLNKVVYNVIQQGNLTFSNQYGSIPLVEIITKLLVRQQIDFIPHLQNHSRNSKEIGHLVITSYFAIPQRQQETSFRVYKLFTVPFFHNNETLQLSDMPQYWAINLMDNTAMEWYKPEEFGCQLQLMTTCRHTPPLYTMTKDTCLGQILHNLPLSQCHTKLQSLRSIFLQQLKDNLWITSSYRSMHCLKIPKIEYRPTNIQAIWTTNEPLILPPVALVNVTPGYTIVCPKFTLVGSPNQTRTSSLTILYKNKLPSSELSVVDIYQYLTENTTWFKRNWTEERRVSLLNHIQQITTTTTTKVITIEKYVPTIQNWFLFIAVMSVLISLLYIIVKQHYTIQHYYKNNQLNL